MAEVLAISMYAKGMTTSDIEIHIRDVYELDISDTTVGRITDKNPSCRKRMAAAAIESIYAVVYLDGKKDVPGLWVGGNESAKYWATVLNSSRNRGVEDILIVCTDNLTGFSPAIEAVYPQTEIQNCIIHQLRNPSKYVSYKDIKALMADLKAVCGAADEPSALEAFYSTKRIHSHCNDMSPSDFEKLYPKAQNDALLHAS